MKKTILYFFIFLITIPFFGQTPPPYYEGVNLNATGAVLFEELARKIKDTQVPIPYVWDAYQQSQEDPKNAANVLRCIGTDCPDLTVSEVSRRLEMPKANASQKCLLY